MADYEKMYQVLNEGVSTAMTELRLRNYGRAEDFLVAARSDAEAILSGGEATEGSEQGG